MNIKEILEKVENFSTHRDYWFVRTDYGKNFDFFYEGNYIAISWDYLTVNDIKTKSDSEIKEIIKKNENLDPSNSKQKGKITLFYNRIKAFFNLKKGDIIIVPSRNSNRLAFGEIMDDEPYEDKDALERGSYFKRRKVKWLEQKGIYQLDPIFFQLKTNQHTISDANRFAPYIDKVIGNLFKKGDLTHYVLNIEKTEDINFKDLSGFMDNIEELITNINSELQFNENIDDFFVKINLQSPGKIELIKKVGKSLAILAFFLSVVACKEEKTEMDPQLQKIYDENESVLNDTKTKIDTLDINISELIQPFKNGK